MRQFESLKMDEENSVIYFLCMDEVVRIICGLGEKIEDEIIKQNILRSLPMRFDAKVSAIEEMKDLDTLKMNRYDILAIYEMWTEKGTTSK